MVDVSIILPVYNAKRYLEDALESVLGQQGVAFELIAIDDASTDGSFELLDRLAVSDLRVRLIRNPENVGHAVGINLGVAAAAAPVVAIMHADDIALPGRFADQYRLLDEQPDIDIVGTWFSCIDSDGQKLDRGPIMHPTNPANVAWHMHFDCFLGHPTVAGRTSVFRENPYDGRFHGAEDYELWGRLLFRHRMSNVPKVLMQYRVHDEQVSQRGSLRLSREASVVRQRAIARLTGREAAPEIADLIAGAEITPARLTEEQFASAGEILTLMIEGFLPRMPPSANVRRVVQNYFTKLAALATATDAPASALHQVWQALALRGLVAQEAFRARSQSK
jgi:hypothetical protein